MTTNAQFLDAASTFTVTDEMTQEKAVEFGVKRHKHWSQSTFYSKVYAAVEAARELELRREEAAAQELAAKAVRDARAAERADVEIWLAMNSTRDGTERRLAVAVSVSRHTLKEFDKEKAKFLKNLEIDPVYAMSWGGGFAEASADRKVALWLLQGFELGCDVETLAAEAQREMLSRAKHGNSRSTSTMSNLMDSCEGQAWAKMFERLVGASFW